MHTLLCSGTDVQVLAAVRVIVREWAKRTGAPDGLTTAFIKQARRAKRLPRLTMHACMHAGGTGTPKSAQPLAATAAARPRQTSKSSESCS